MSLLHHLTIMRSQSGDLFPSIGQQANGAPMGSHEYPSMVRCGLDYQRSSLVQTHQTPCSWAFYNMHCHLTDVHIRDEGPFLNRVISEVRGLEPDLIVLTGDLITKGWTSRAIDLFLAALSDVPKLAILGNWEHWVVGNISDWKERLARFNVQLLVDDVISLRIKGVDIQVIGTDDH